MKISAGKLCPFSLLIIFTFAVFFFPETAAVGEENLYSIGNYLKDEAGPLFIISSLRPLDRTRLSGCGQVLEFSDRSALVRTTQSQADRLAGEGMEITRVFSPARSAPKTAVPLRKYLSAFDDLMIGSIIERVVLLDVFTLLGKISGEESVTIGGETHFIRSRNSYRTIEITRATQYCYEYLRDLTLTVSYHNYTWENNNWRNVVAEQPGTIHPDQVLIICAHLDDMPEGSLAPGADDNGSGSVAVLLAGSILSDYSFENTIRYLLFTGEEQGLIGSRYYVQDCAAAGDNILGVLNFDMISYDSNSDGAMEIYCGTMAASEVVGDLFIDTISRFDLSLECTKNTTVPSWSDQYRFWEAGYPAIVGIESDQDFNPNYHTTKDTRVNCNLLYMTEFVKAAVGTIARMAAPVTEPPIIEFGDYDGDGTSDPSIFRPSSGLWAVRGCTRFYFGSSSDRPVPGDYNGDGCCDAAIFRESIGLWSLRMISRFYFGGYGDDPAPGDYNGNGTQEVALFRPSGGLWAIRNLSRLYFGSAGDLGIPGDYDGNGCADPSVFRPSSGLWAIRGITHIYFGSASDYPVPGDYDGDGNDEIGIFRDGVGLWAERDISRIYFGTTGDIPVAK